MKRIIVSLVIGLSAMSSSAFALVGGPFDNGFHGGALDSANAIYQANFSMLNGTGFCYFSPEAIISNIGSATAATTFDNRGSMKNRSVVYYKGVTYVGSAFGSVDAETRHVEAEMNGTSELTLTVTNTTQQSGFFTSSQSSSSVQGTVVASNRGFAFNGAFTAQIYRTAPTLRFKGNGELLFLAPTSPDSVAGLAYNAYSGLIDAIITFIAGSRVQPNVTLTGIFTDAQNAINNALGGLTPYLNLGGINSTLQNGKKALIRVTGTRRYL